MMLLTDHQVQSFISSGLMEIALPELDQVHYEIDLRLREICETESHHGNNILPRMPILQQVLRHEKIHGALVSLLGPGYLVHPHRAIHRSTPLKEALEDFSFSADRHLMGHGSTATSIWHQDAQSPLARARHHFPRFLIGFYFPHEVDSAMGPTRFLRASYCDNGPYLNRTIYQPEHVRAGTFFLGHFDIAHAGFPNISNIDRFMLKFVFARTNAPTSPTWNNESANWSSVDNESVETSLYEPAAAFIWNRMLGRTGAEPASKTSQSSLSPTLASQDKRLKMIYGGREGLSIPDCMESLGLVAGKRKHERLQENLRDSTKGYPIRWNERAIVVETAAYRLAALGENSVDAIHSLMELKDPWLQVNAAFVAGEIGVGTSELTSHLKKLLQSPHHQVVRQAIDALALTKIDDDRDLLQQLKNLVSNKRHSWQSALVQRGWSAGDQIDINIAMFLLSKHKYYKAHDFLDLAVLILKKSNDYACSIVGEALIRSRGQEAQELAINYFQDRAWNTSLLGKNRAY